MKIQSPCHERSLICWPSSRLIPGRVFDRQTLLDRVWGEDAYVDDRTVDVHIRWLREKIEPTPGKPVHLLTIRGVGYKFQG